MQPEGPYRYTHALGGSPVGKAWAAIDDQGRFVTVAVLDAAVAATPAWREAFTRTANALAQAPDGMSYAYADFAATEPWVAYPAHVGPGAERLFRALGVEYTPVPTAVSPTSAPPVSSPPQPVSGAPEQVSGPSHAPWAVQATPTSGQPVSASPQSGGPAAPLSPAAVPAPVPQQPAAYGSMPHHGGTAVSPSPQPVHDPFTATGRRIAPVQPPKRRGWLPIAAGALVLTLVAGAAGFILGKGSEGEPVEAAPSASAPLPPYEATQFALNKARFEGELAPLAEPWLTRLGGCVTYNQAGAPKLPADEKGHIFCNYGGAWLHFTLYPGKKQKDIARTYRHQLNLSGGDLAPGLREATRTTGGVTGAAGSYVEYAFKSEDGRAICGVWWDRDDIDAGFYVEAFCESGIDGNWDALRDLWKRGS